MGYSTNQSKLQGDPGLFGSLGKLVGKVGGLIPGPIGTIATIIGGAGGGGGSRGGGGTVGTPPFTMPGGSGIISSRLQERVPVPGIVGAAQRLIPGGQTGFTTRPKKRRRMDPLNVKALRRSTRRLAAFQREAKKVEKELRKLAPPARRRSSSAHHHHPRA